MSTTLRRLLPISMMLSILLPLGGCSDDDPSGPQNSLPLTLVAPLEGAVVDVPLVADEPTDIVLTLQLPPDISAVDAVEIDVAATLDHVRIDGISLWSLIARKAARIAGKADAIGATAHIRVGSDATSVCDQGILYGPFTVAHETALEVSPPTVSADAATLGIINTGTMVLCVTVTANIDALLSVDGVAMEITEGDCGTPTNFAGTWTGSYECGNSCGDPFGDSITLTVTQDGSQATYTDSGGYTYTGRVCGNTFRFEYSGEDFVERGTLTIESPGIAVKRSTWRNTFPPYCGGDCVDHLTRSSGGGGDCPPLVITSGAPPDGQVGVAYSYTLTTSGGEGPVTRWVTTPVPIPGLEVTESGTLVGTPTAAAIGTWEVNMTAYDSCPEGTQVANLFRTITISD